ncbi:nitronate monooxygenase [Streptomyces sp. SID3343]|uniref:NAD(P)H-dependent flavin oxidoreductase n=1 Tax=Streptomyces sp. SID3343 TaxID=2690260 RepID=UPI00192844A1|nr:nitronate monooxygenase [Streptomyces sp. SID3343]
MLTTPLCDLLGIDAPLIQAPVGSASCPALVAAVSRAGALGMLSFTWAPVEQVATDLAELGVLLGPDVPFGVNFILDFSIEEKLALCLKAGVRVVSTFWGDPAPFVERIHAAGAVHLHTVGSAVEAVRAVEAGVDAVVCQGWEAGGHVWGTAASLPLIPAVVDAVSPVPVIAAGGIADGRGLAAVLTLGAQAAWVGTRFLASEEARTHEVYRSRVVAAAETDAVHTLAFDGGWPGAAHRALWNSTLEAWEAAGRPAASERPGEGDVVASGPWGDQLRYGDMMPLPGMRGDLEAMALYAGQSAGLVREVLPAARIVEGFVREATDVLSRLGGV